MYVFVKVVNFDEEILEIFIVYMNDLIVFVMIEEFYKISVKILYKIIVNYVCFFFKDFFGSIGDFFYEVFVVVFVCNE